MSVPTLLQVREHDSGLQFVTVKTPSAITWSIQDVSAQDAGRTLDGIMHKERLPMPNGQKRKMKLEWFAVKFGEESSALLQAFTPEYLDVTYPDPQEGKLVTKVFYTGDKELRFATWWDGKQVLTNLTFSLIEQ